jgi:hypothetical protein
MVVQHVEPWMSEADTDRGMRWGGIVKTSGSACHALLPARLSVTRLTFATVLAVVKPLGRIRGGRTPGVQRR